MFLDYWERVGRQRTSTLLCGLQKMGKRGYFCVFLNEVGVRLSSLLSDMSRPEGAGGGGGLTEQLSVVSFYCGCILILNTFVFVIAIGRFIIGEITFNFVRRKG